MRQKKTIFSEQQSSATSKETLGSVKAAALASFCGEPFRGSYLGSKFAHRELLSLVALVPVIHVRIPSALFKKSGRSIVKAYTSYPKLSIV